MEIIIQKFWNEYIKIQSKENKKIAINTQLETLQWHKKELVRQYAVIDTEMNKLTLMNTKL